MSHWHETYRVPATITLHEGERIEGDIHLQTLTPMHGGSETPVEMLNRPEHFFAVSLPDGGVSLVCKAQTAVVTCDASMWEVDEQRRAISRSLELEVRLIDGMNLNGTAYWELPPTHPRPQDFLNVSEAFFEITDDGVSHCINRSLVGQVRPKE